MTKEKKKIFSKGAVMDVVLNPLVSIGMYKAIKEKQENISAYIRSLIMKDLNIDEYGRKN